ncbi:MAG: stage II sporulation protein R [bacterium]|nr:stage II sporulation protein R [bacterium]
MKKIILITLLFAIIICSVNEEDKISEDSIRFRVIANSNSLEDITMKEKVVEELSEIIFTNKSRDEIKKNILNNLSTIENRIDKIFENNNYNKTYNIVYGLNEFPKKEYNGKVYDEGLYESLVIEIGDAKGNNYWCFLYPSLCMSDFENKRIEKNNIDDNNIQNKTIKFKFIELIKDIF